MEDSDIGNNSLLKKRRKSYFFRKLTDKFRQIRIHRKHDVKSMLDSSILNFGSTDGLKCDLDPTHEERLLSVEIDALKKEEDELTNKLAEVIGLIGSMEKIDKKTRRQEDNDYDIKTREFKRFHEQVKNEIADINEKKSRLVERFNLATKLIDLLRKQLNDIKNQHKSLQNNINGFDEKIKYLQRKLRQAYKRHKKDLLLLDEALRLRRSDDEALIEVYRSNEKRLREALDKRRIIRKSLEERNIEQEKEQENPQVSVIEEPIIFEIDKNFDFYSIASDIKEENDNDFSDSSEEEKGEDEDEDEDDEETSSYSGSSKDTSTSRENSASVQASSSKEDKSKPQKSELEPFMPLKEKSETMIAIEVVEEK